MFLRSVLFVCFGIFSIQALALDQVIKGSVKGTFRGLGMASGRASSESTDDREKSAATMGALLGIASSMFGWDEFSLVENYAYAAADAKVKLASGALDLDGPLKSVVAVEEAFAARGASGSLSSPEARSLSDVFELVVLRAADFGE